MSKTLLIDANSIFHAAQHATKLTSGGLETQAVFGAVKTARQLRITYPEFAQVWCHDTRATWRFELNPDYKSGRSDTPEKVRTKDALNAQRPFIHRALASLGLRQITATGYEADDIIGFMSTRLAEKSENEIGIISGDRDLCQLVKSNVWWRDMRDDDRTLNWKTFFDKTGYATPFGFLQGKCLMGDSSDCIGGVGGIGEKGAPEFIAEYGSVRKFWAACDSGSLVPTRKPLIKLCSAEGRAIYGRNFRLMQLLQVAPPQKESMDIRPGAFDKGAFEDLCGELAFFSILKNIDNFTKDFQ